MVQRWQGHGSRVVQLRNKWYLIPIKKVLDLSLIAHELNHDQMLSKCLPRQSNAIVWYDIAVACRKVEKKTIKDDKKTTKRRQKDDKKNLSVVNFSTF